MKRLVCVVILALAGAVAGEELDPKLTGQMDAVIQSAVDQGQIPGAVLLIGKGDRDVYVKAYGWRVVKPEKVAMTVDTVFDLASLTKCVACAPSVMLLVQRGKLDVHAPVAKYIPAFGANGKEAITVEQLLLHHSGLIPDNGMADYADGPAKAMERIYALKPYKKPGESFVYSDVNYIVLGELVRVVDGRPLDQFAREEIFAPLGMEHTAYNPPAAWKTLCAPTQERNGHWMIGEVHDPRAYALGGVAGHAGVFSTVQDLARFCRMFCGGKSVLKGETVAEMTKARFLPDGTGCRGYGFDIDTPYSGPRGSRFEKGTTFGHTGFTGTSLWIDPKHQCFVILLCSSRHPDGKGGEILKIRRQVGTLAGEALLGPGTGATGKPQ